MLELLYFLDYFRDFDSCFPYQVISKGVLIVAYDMNYVIYTVDVYLKGFIPFRLFPNIIDHISFVLLILIINDNEGIHLAHEFSVMQKVTLYYSQY
jgi:hypothetical protein